MTPEGKVKAQVKKLLAKYDIWPAHKAGVFPVTARGWYHMLVKTPHGANGIPDFQGHYRGYYFGIETKAPGKEPTGFQLLQVKSIQMSGGAVFVVSDEESLEVFKVWLTRKLWEI